MVGSKSVQPFKDYTAQEHQTWQRLFERQAAKRESQMVPEFGRGLLALQIDGSKIPDLDQVNRQLKERTGFKGVPVNGFEEPSEFFEMLAQREFPIGNFIRDAQDLNYTPAPDVFHDLYGHLPFFVDEDYATFCEDFGRRAKKYLSKPEVVKQFDRLFWFTIEFALQQTERGPRIFGAGIASSFTECAYSLSAEPKVLAFDVDVIRKQDFRIDILQTKLFKIDSRKQLFGCLDEFESKING